MSLENTVAKYEILVQKTGTGGQDAANELKKAAEGAKASGEELRSLREHAMLARESMHGLTEIAIVAGAEKFPELTEAVMAARTAMLATRSAAMVTGASLATVGMVVGGIVAAVGVAALAWGKHREELKANEEQAKKTKEAIAALPETLTQIQTLQNAGLISPMQAGAMRTQLGVAGAPAPITSLQYQGFYGPASNAQMGSASMGHLTLPGYMNANNAADVQAEIAKIGATKEQIEALHQIQQLREKIDTETLTGFDKERAAAKVAYDEQLTRLKALEAQAGHFYSGKDEQQLAAAFNTKIAGINQKEDDQVYERLAKGAGELDKQLQQIAKDQEKAFGAQWKQEEEGYIAAQKEMIKLRGELSLQTVSGAAREKMALDQRYNDEIEKIDQLSQQLGLSREEEQSLLREAAQGYKNLSQQIDTAKLHVMSLQQMEESAANSFASGLGNAIVEFASGTKSAKQAFEDFARSFLMQIAEMIIQQEILNALKAMFFGGGGTAVSAQAGGGVTYAAGGLSGIGSVNSATYFPRFNVVAGEAGREMLTVLARPRVMEVGGMEAVVGNAGRNRLAITNADDLAQRTGRGGSDGGLTHIHVTMDQGLKAEIIEQSSKNAVVQVTHQAQQNSQFRKAMKKGIA